MQKIVIPVFKIKHLVLNWILLHNPTTGGDSTGRAMTLVGQKMNMHNFRTR
jgi:hypothetical protein